MNELSIPLKIKPNGRLEAEIRRREDRGSEKGEILVSCLEDQIVTQQPACIGQRRYVSSTTFNQLATGLIFDLGGRKLREILPNKDGRPGSLLGKLRKVLRTSGTNNLPTTNRIWTGELAVFKYFVRVTECNN